MIRDHTKKFLIANGRYYGIKCNIWAEAKAMLKGMRLANENFSSPIWIESDSLILILIINALIKCQKSI